MPPIKRGRLNLLVKKIKIMSIESHSISPTEKSECIGVYNTFNGRFIANLPLGIKPDLPADNYMGYNIGIWKKKEQKQGVLSGDLCNRNECKGIIQLHRPIRICRPFYEFCPECGWEPEQP